jgi:hypothetical protein
MDRVSPCSLPRQVGHFLFVSPPETSTKRQAVHHGCLPSLLLLDDGDKGIEIVYGEKYFQTGLTRSSRAGQKNSCIGTTSSMNQPRKNPFHLYSLSRNSPQFQQSAGGHPSLVSLFRTGAGCVPLIPADNREETDMGGAFLTCFRCVLDSNMCKGVCSIVPSMLVSLLYFVTLIPYESGREDCKE